MAFLSSNYARFFRLMARVEQPLLQRCLLFLLAPKMRQRALGLLDKALHKNERWVPLSRIQVLDLGADLTLLSFFSLMMFSSLQGTSGEKACSLP